MTVICPLANSYLQSATASASAVAELAATGKVAKYSALKNQYIFQPIAVESLGPMNRDASSFMPTLDGRFLSFLETRKLFLFQRIVLLSQFNSALGFITQLFWLGRLPRVLTFPFFLTFQCFSYRHFHKGLKNNNNKNNNNNNDYFIFLLFLLFTVNKVRPCIIQYT